MVESLLNTEDTTIPLKKSKIDLLLEIIIMDLISRFNINISRFHINYCNGRIKKRNPQWL